MFGIYSVSDRAGDIATVVKLYRVALLVPTMLAVSFLFSRARDGETARKPSPLPLFAVAFAVLVAVNSTGLVPPVLSARLNDLSRWCLVIAVAAIGLSTSLQDIFKVGYRSVAVACGATLVLLAYSLATIEWTM